MKLIDLDSLPAQDWLMLRLYEVSAPYQALRSGEVTVDHLESFCGAIRFALFEFSAHSRRSPGRFTASARALITIAEQVIKIGHASRPRGKGADSKWTLVLDSISNHRQQFQTCLEASLQAARQQAREWKKATSRVHLPEAYA